MGTGSARRLSVEDRASVVGRYLSGETCLSIGAALGVSGQAIWGLLTRRGVNLRSRSEAATRHTLRHDAFDHFSRDMEYWCGFIAADGALVVRSSSAPELAVVLAARDRLHLVKLRKFLGSTHAITDYVSESSLGGSARLCRFSLRSLQIVSRLQELGVKKGPLASNLVQSGDFWRGVVDGDGWVGTSQGVPRLELVGEYWLLNDFVRFLRLSKAPTKATVRSHKSIYRIGFCRGSAVAVTRLLYLDMPVGLDRKGEVAARILRPTNTQGGAESQLGTVTAEQGVVAGRSVPRVAARTGRGR